jgi:Domain of unknown function (DUF4430)
MPRESVAEHLGHNRGGRTSREKHKARRSARKPSVGKQRKSGRRLTSPSQHLSWTADLFLTRIINMQTIPRLCRRAIPTGAMLTAAALPTAILIASLLTTNVGCIRRSDDAAEKSAASVNSAKAGADGVPTDGAGRADAVNHPEAVVDRNKAAAGQAATRTVELVIDYGDGVQKRLAHIPWRDHLTALDVLTAAQNHPHGITFVARGAGPTAFVTRLDDLENQGGSPDAKNWVFRINDRLVDEGCGVAEVRPGDVILWKFGAYE